MTAADILTTAAPDDAGSRVHDLVVSIINYRTARMTIDSAASALAEIAGLDARVVIVDNASGDGSVEVLGDWVASLGPDAPVTLVRSATNTGFTGGHNQGFAAHRAHAYMIFNSDALLRPGSLRIMMDALARNPGVGMVAPRLEDEDGTPQLSCFRFDSPLSELIRGAQLGPVTRLLRRWDTRLPETPEPADIDWFSGCCILIRAEMMAAIGVLDEGYFLYFDDCDYCLRARRAGWRYAYVPEARVVHFRGGSAPVKKLTAARKRVPAYFYASRTRFLRRAWGHGGLLAANLLYSFGRALNLARYLMGDPPRRVAKEWLDIWTNFLNPEGDPRAPRT